MWRRVQLVTLAGEKYAEAALISSAAINSASASFTHSVSTSPLSLPFPLNAAFVPFKAPGCRVQRPLVVKWENGKENKFIDKHNNNKFTPNPEKLCSTKFINNFLFFNFFLLTH